MSEAEARPTNFIRQIVDEDLASGKHTSVHTRFPPEPNGYLHIGHAKSICLNFGIAKDYQGQCNLRFDDTNPVKEDIEFVESIKHDVEWLGFEWSGNVRYSSDYFDQLHQYAVELITKGLAYVDELSPEQIREYRGTLTAPGKDSPYRGRSVEENLALFEKMRNGEFAEGAACLRAKIDMASPFIVMRDPVLYRIKFAEHHQTGNKWCIYPMYDFTHCISDALEGITHSLCTLEFQDNRRLYDWVLDNITIPCHPRQYEFSRLNLEYAIMSKRKLHQLVAEKIVEGWDDPRMPTVSGLRRRGYTAASIREFCLRIGVTKQDNNVEMVALESCIRDDLNENAPRAMAVLDPVKIVIENMGDAVEMVTMPNHPNKPEMGSRDVPFSREIYIDRADFREEANKQYKLSGAGQGSASAQCVRDQGRARREGRSGRDRHHLLQLRCGNAEQRSCRRPQGEGRDPLRQRRTRCRRKFACTIACSACLIRARRRISSPPSTRNRWSSSTASSSRAWRLHSRRKPISSSVKVTSAPTTVTRRPSIWCLTAPSACVTPGRKSKANLIRLEN